MVEAQERAKVGTGAGEGGGTGHAELSVRLRPGGSQQPGRSTTLACISPSAANQAASHSRVSTPVPSCSRTAAAACCARRRRRSCPAAMTAVRPPQPPGQAPAGERCLAWGGVGCRAGCAAAPWQPPAGAKRTVMQAGQLAGPMDEGRHEIAQARRQAWEGSVAVLDSMARMAQQPGMHAHDSNATQRQLASARQKDGLSWSTVPLSASAGSSCSATARWLSSESLREQGA